MITAENSDAQIFWQKAINVSNASGNYAAVPHSSSLNITGSFTIEMWISPNTSGVTSTLLQKRFGSSNSGYTLLMNSGRPTIRTNSQTRLTGKTVVPSNNWSHIAGTYNSSTNVFSIYINGILDTTSTVVSAQPVSNTDSVLIGTGFNGAFNGKMDEVRIWNRALSVSEISSFRRISLGASSGIYSGLVMSLTFQDLNSVNVSNDLTDKSGNNNNGFSAVNLIFDQSNRPNATTSLNECLDLDGTGDYLSGPDDANSSPTFFITIEAWLFPRSTAQGTIVHKGTPNGSVTDYRLTYDNGNIIARINDATAVTLSGNQVPLNRWTHVAFRYSGVNGLKEISINGVRQIQSFQSFGAVRDGVDSLFIGGTSQLASFNGLIDEVRISSNYKSDFDINENLFESIDEANDQAGANICYNFDGYTSSSSDPGPRLSLRNNARFSNQATAANVPVSPLNRADSRNFQQAFYSKADSRRIPASGTSGLMNQDSLEITLNQTINDVNLFIALNHTDVDNLVITLIAPNGESSIVYSTSALLPTGDNIITVFDDQADSSIISNRYIGFGPVIKPALGLNSVFSGDNTSGFWKLRIQDISSGDTGRIYGWGIQFNDQSVRSKVFSLNAIIEGFYDSLSNSMIPDTVSLYLHNEDSPFNALDSAKGILNSSGKGIFVFNNIGDNEKYYVVIKHRNSIQTWSKFAQGPFRILTSQSNYSFTFSNSAAFGDNEIQVDRLPFAFALYGGDVNQDEIVDATDLSLITNDAFNFTTGYVDTDLNGDQFVDGSDATIAINNAFNFITVQRP
ncbi:MAG: proprotein convertase P-domain-containing protein [Ignavibacteria bacterium]|nr:proprotein convertase P-domain-containing protein [Ignavibacteria bacterium]